VTITHGDVIAAIDELLPLVRRRVDDIQVGRRLSDDVELGLRASGVNRMVLPAVVGGFETPPARGRRRVAPARRPLAVRQQLPACRVDRPRGRAPSRRGRQRPGPPIGARPSRGPLDRDTWDVVGLRGTGSHHVTAAGVTVEPRHCCEFIGDPWPVAPLWRMPVFSVILAMLAAVALGIAGGALDELGQQVRDGRAGVRRGDLAGDPLAMHDRAAAELRLGGCPYRPPPTSWRSPQPRDLQRAAGTPFPGSRAVTGRPSCRR
jgi:hypothetical protein